MAPSLLKARPQRPQITEQPSSHTR